jgi:hypothetical protein
VAILGGAVLIGLAVNLYAAHRQAAEKPGPAAPCRPAHPVYGRPPSGLSYTPASTVLRRRTLKALGLGGSADLKLVTKGGTTYGEVVGVPTRDPQGFVERKAREGHAKLGASGYALIPNGNGNVVAVGARGCRAVYVAAATPDDVRVLAAAVFS